MATGYQQFISVMTPAASAGDVTFQITTIDATENISLTFSASGLSPADDEITLAEEVQEQLTTFLTQTGALYGGLPAFHDEDLPAVFIVERTDHVVSLAAQCRFRIKETDNETGAIFVIGSGGVFSTVTEARDQGTLAGVTFVTTAGVTLTDLQVATLLEICSRQLQGYTKNAICAAGYFRALRGRDTTGVSLKPKPGIHLDPPRFRQQDLLLQLSESVYETSNYNWDPDTNKLSFKYPTNYVNIGEPFRLNNQVMVSFTAGHMTIPTAIKFACLDMAKGVASGNSGKIESLQGGSFHVVFQSTKDQLYLFMIPLKSFIL